MSSKLLFPLLILALNAQAQNSVPAAPDPFEARYWGVVLDDPAMKNVIVRKNVPYFKDDKAVLAMDI
jgi:hypothetical protein